MNNNTKRSSYLVVAFAVLALVWSITTPTRAQTPHQVLPPGTLELDGRLARCGASWTEIVSAGPNGGYAWYSFARDVIILNHDQYYSQPTFLKLFIYAHECGHKVRGASEDEADCFAARIGRDQGWFHGANFPLLVAQLRNSPGDWTHRPGPMRLQHIANCYHT